MHTEHAACGCGQRRRSLKTTLLTGTGANQQVAGPDPRRIGVYLSARDDSAIALKFGSACSAVNDGFIYRSNCSNVELFVSDYGEEIRQSINVLASLNAAFSVVEVFEI